MLLSVIFDILSTVCIVYLLIYSWNMVFPSHATRTKFEWNYSLGDSKGRYLCMVTFPCTLNVYTTRLCKLLMNKLFWEYFSEHEENWFLLVQQYLYENATDVISCRNEAAFIPVILNRILIKSSKTAKVPVLQLDFHQESHSILNFFPYFLSCGRFVRRILSFL